MLKLTEVINQEVNLKLDFCNLHLVFLVNVRRATDIYDMLTHHLF